MKAREIRETFLQFFEGHGHQRIKSSSLIPANDPTLLFTNAGMVQFKDYFLGLDTPPSKRAATAQKCVRAGGKHNDLENVGFTPRHHTFFEMLGNFSFGDYFKEEALAMAWELLTKKLMMPVDKLRVTVFETDDEAEAIWKKIGVRSDRIERLGAADNFWAMGDTGPCGPCSEIYFDWGMEHAKVKGQDGTPGTDSTRFVEIWNNVFMQFNRSADGTMTPLPKPSVDTGAGLERMAAAMQGKYSNYETDIFQTLISDISKRVGMPYDPATKFTFDKTDVAPEPSVSMRVIADHIRSGTFLLSDGVSPSNEGRGYVLRRILRRAIRHGKNLNQEKPFLNELIPSVVREFGDIYPELKKNQAMLQEQMKEEEVRFHETLHRGMGILEEAIGTVKKSGGTAIPGAVAFKLYDTYGFPFDLIEVIAKEQKLGVDGGEYNALLDKQRAQSGGKASTKLNLTELAQSFVGPTTETKFLGYDGVHLVRENEPVLALVTEDGKPAQEIKSGQSGFVVFGHTPFYAESGGQVGDIGMITSSGSQARVEDTIKANKTFLHKVHVIEGKLTIGMPCTLKVDNNVRLATAINHTATHLMHAALRKVLGDRVKQAGSHVDSNRLRFDFSFPRQVSPEERMQIEELVNEEIKRGTKVTKAEMAYDDAVASGALAFFDEKYGDKVRVIRVGAENPFSVELCGGTHLDEIGIIRKFRITSESSVASGVRRIEGVTAVGADKYEAELQKAAHERDQKLHHDIVMLEKDLLALGVNLKKELTGKSLDEQKTFLAKALAKEKTKGAASAAGSLHEKARDVNGYKVVTETVEAENPGMLRTMVDQVRDKLQSKAIVFLVSDAGGKVSLALGLTKDLVPKLDAGQLMKPLAEVVGGRGGGKADFAQAGGTNAAGITPAMDKLIETIKGL